ncbi:putative cytochrome b5-like heme/steroid binding domain superfamily [Helianthus annuus]|nr:putative cytochrome b5-like heme/steroid binding domain superfamily [Helianthus annuus]
MVMEKDATEDFEDVGHSQNAIDMMKDYYVGEVDSNTMPRKNTYNKPPSSTTSATAQASGSSSTNILTFVLPILILVLAYALYHFANKKVAVSFTHL